MMPVGKTVLVSFLILAWTLSSASLQASVGETEAQVAARYGEPTSRQQGAVKNHQILGYTFQKNYAVLVQFVDGISQWEHYSNEGKALSPAEVQMFLAMNSGGKHWRQSETNQWSISPPAQKDVGNTIDATTGPGFPDLHQPGLTVSTGAYVMFVFAEVIGPGLKKAEAEARSHTATDQKKYPVK
jgi:hypothetical protein